MTASDMPLPPLIGHQSQASFLQDQAQQGRLHHAWLLTGPEGIGKSLFAQHYAAYLLDLTVDGHENRKMAVAFSETRQSKAMAMMVAGSHPDYRYVQFEEGRASRTISVQQIRGLSPLFSTTSGMGGWRVVVIDAADHLNVQAANALLKMLEEPPKRCLFLIICHQPGQVLPTIKSRCQQLKFTVAPDKDGLAILATARPNADDEERALALSLSGGAPGQACLLLDGHVADYATTIGGLIENLPAMDMTKVLGLADQLGDRAAAENFDVCLNVINTYIHRAITTCSRARDEQEANAPWMTALSVPDWLDLADALQTSARQVKGLTLSPRQAFISLFATMRTMATSASGPSKAA